MIKLSQNMNQFFEIILLGISNIYQWFLQFIFQTIPRKNRLQKIILEHCTLMLDHLDDFDILGVILDMIVLPQLE